MSKSALSTKLLHAIDRIELDLDDDKSVSILKGVHINLCALERENETLKAELEDHKYLIEEHERTIINHEKEIERKSDLWLEACKKLEVFQNGLPIEKAKTDGTVYNWHDGEEWRIIYYRQLEPKGWTDGTSTEKRKGFYSWTETNFIEPKRVYPLPSTETQMEGE